MSPIGCVGIETVDNISVLSNKKRSNRAYSVDTSGRLRRKDEE
jgi:hypothetical protein